VEDVDVFYDVTVAGDIEVEVSPDGSNWRPFHTETVGSGGGSDVLQLSTTYRYVRVYANSGDFADSDVNTVEISAKAEVQ
jgi:hypothetical protein